MKQWILLVAALLVGLSAEAQRKYYVGGDISFGVGSSGSSIVVYPEVGTRIANNVYLGLAAGFDWNNYSNQSDFTMGLIPHLRGYLPLYQRFGLSGDLYFSSRWTRREGLDPLRSSTPRRWASAPASSSPSATPSSPRRSASSAGTA